MAWNQKKTIIFASAATSTTFNQTNCDCQSMFQAKAITKQKTIDRDVISVCVRESLAGNYIKTLSKTKQNKVSDIYREDQEPAGAQSTNKKESQMKYILTHIFSSMLVNTRCLGFSVKKKSARMNEWIAKCCVTQSEQRSTTEAGSIFCDYLSSCFEENTNMNVKCVRSTKIDAAAAFCCCCVFIVCENMQLY